MEPDTIDGMSWGSVEEVLDWIEGLSVAEFGHVAFYIDLLAERGALLSEPYTKQLDATDVLDCTRAPDHFPHGLC